MTALLSREKLLTELKRLKQHWFESSLPMSGTIMTLFGGLIHDIEKGEYAPSPSSSCQGLLPSVHEDKSGDYWIIEYPNGRGAYAQRKAPDSASQNQLNPLEETLVLLCEHWNTRSHSGWLPMDFKNSAQWMLRALVCLANRALIDTNAGLEDEQDWPAGQEWHELGHTSQHTFMRIARKEAGIPDSEYKAFIGKYLVDFDLDEIWQELVNRSESDTLINPKVPHE